MNVKRNLLAILAVLSVLPMWGAGLQLSQEEWKKLESQTISSVKWERAILDYPRQVGKNAKRDIHGWGPVISVCVLQTGEYEGISEVYEPSDRQRTETRKAIVGKKVTDLIDSRTLLVRPEYRNIDIAIYDLVGVILQKQAHRLFGIPACEKIKLYSGAIYFDDLEFDDPEEGIRRVLENARWDYDYGYRQLKLKLGRGFMWMDKKEGMARDIEITRRIHEMLPDVELLVDANDGWTINECIAYLDSIRPIKLYWVEEPFRENVNDLRTLKVWKLQNAPEMYVVDGEFKPNHAEMMDLARKGLLDMFLQDILSYGFTNWIELLPQLTELGLQASPHCWKSLTKNIYAAYFGMAFGHVPTVEGVTCTSKDLDFGGYKIVDGYFVPSEKPGFGITRIK